LYSGPENNADFHSDKDKKIAYLQKIITVVELATGSAIDAKPQKIVAGLEPEVNNYLLRLLISFCSSFTRLRQVENHRILLLTKFLEKQSQNQKKKNLKRNKLKDHHQQLELKNLRKLKNLQNNHQQLFQKK